MQTPLSGVTHYDRLGIAPNSSTATIREAYRRTARRAHPDLHGELAHDEMAEVNEAWRVLRDPRSRRDYDELLAVLSRLERSAAAGTAFVHNGDERSRPTFRWKLLIGAQLIAAFVAVLIIATTRHTAVTRSNIRSGACVRVGPSGSYAHVDCAEQHDAVVAAVVRFGQSCPETMLPLRSPTARFCAVPDAPGDTTP
jgi:hypothetical protein